MDEGRSDWRKFGGVGRGGGEGISRGRAAEGVVRRGVVGGGFTRWTPAGAGDGSWTSFGVGKRLDLVGGESRKMVTGTRSVGSNLGTGKEGVKIETRVREQEMRRTEAPAGVAIPEMFPWTKERRD